MLDRYLLRYVIAVVEQGNFSRAAAACNVSQPTLSIGIAKLERELGQPLFVRSNQRVELTEAGTRFLIHARRIEREFNAAIQAVGTPGERPSFRLGVLASSASDRIATAIAATRPVETHRFELVFGTERELAGHLAKGRIDVALTLVERGGNRFLERAIATEDYALALPADHRLAGETTIAAERLAGETMIVRRHCEALADTSRHFTERGVRPPFALRSTNDERVLQMVAAGLGITVMPRGHRQAGVVRPSLAGFGLTRTLGWAVAPTAEPILAGPPAVMTGIEAALTADASR